MAWEWVPYWIPSTYSLRVVKAFKRDCIGQQRCSESSGGWSYQGQRRLSELVFTWIYSWSPHCGEEGNGTTPSLFFPRYTMESHNSKSKRNGVKGTSRNRGASLGRPSMCDRWDPIVIQHLSATVTSCAEAPGMYALSTAREIGQCRARNEQDEN